MLAEIITIGDEILIGQIVDTNSAHISAELNKIGIQVYQITSIQDDRAHILQTFIEAKDRVDVVLITGGLGPTKDDITKQTLCDFLGDTLVENKAVKANIHALFSKYIKRDPLPENLEQAMVPSTARILNNKYGTAPGLWMQKEDTVFISMPGVPYEMKHLMKDEVIPQIIEKFDRPHIYHKTLLTYGMGESAIGNRIMDWEENLPETIKLAYLPSFGSVRLRLSSKGANEIQVKEAVNAQMSLLHAMLSDIAVGYEDETNVGQRIGQLLLAKGHTVSLAESCTGGAIAQAITKNAGASAYFKGSAVTYHTNIKTTVLGVDAKLIEEHTVVSEPVAKAMAQHAKELFDTDYAIATTGIAGPSKGDATDEVGTVFIALATPEAIHVEKFDFGKPRERVIAKATNKSLEMLLKEISKN